MGAAHRAPGQGCPSPFSLGDLRGTSVSSHSPQGCWSPDQTGDCFRVVSHAGVLPGSSHISDSYTRMHILPLGLACVWSLSLGNPVTCSTVWPRGRGTFLWPWVVSKAFALCGVFQLSAFPWCLCGSQVEPAVSCLGSGCGVPAGTGASAPRLCPYLLKGPL